MRMTSLLRRPRRGNAVTPRRDPVHDLWSRVVRTRDGWRCRKCGRARDEGYQMHAAHVLGRGRASKLRYHVGNGVTLCFPCHRWFDTHRGRDGEAERWVREVLGEEDWTELLMLERIVKRADPQFARVALTEALKQLGAHTGK